MASYLLFLFDIMHTLPGVRYGTTRKWIYFGNDPESFVDSESFSRILFSVVSVCSCIKFFFGIRQVSAPILADVEIFDRC